MNTPSRPEPAVSTAATALAAWFPTFMPRPAARLRLIGFPYAGGGMHVFRAWQDQMPATIELRIVQLPGRGARLREERFLQTEVAIDALEQAILPLLDRPFAFFGHSLGAVLAFEMTRRLRARGLVPTQLLVSGRIAPQLPSPFPVIHQLSEGNFLEKVKELNGMTQAVLDSKELLEIVLPIIRADFCLLETYRYRGSPPSVSCPITVFGGDRDPQTTRESLEAWGDQTDGGFELRMMAGDHFFVDSARALVIKTVLEKLGKPG